MRIELGFLNKKSIAIYVNGRWYDTVSPKEVWSIYLDLSVGY